MIRSRKNLALSLLVLLALVVLVSGGCANLGTRNCPYTHGFPANHCSYNYRHHGQHVQHNCCRHR